jgi:hypothetical protein
VRNVFVVRQLYHYSERQFAHTEHEAVFSTFDAAHKYMLERLSNPDASVVDLQCFRNEITEIRLDTSNEPDRYLKKVYLPTGELHIDFTSEEDCHYDVVDGTPGKFAVGDLVRILPDYLFPGSVMFQGGIGVIGSLADRSSTCRWCNEYDYDVFVLTDRGRLCGLSTLEAALETLSEPLDVELEFLQRLSGHLKGKKLLSKEMSDRLDQFQSDQPLYLLNTEIYDFTTGSILKA